MEGFSSAALSSGQRNGKSSPDDLVLIEFELKIVVGGGKLQEGIVLKNILVLSKNLVLLYLYLTVFHILLL